ncbi:MAG: hypothetical protein KDK39_14995 [Leptospiraceae bacterium]|nr:hypothetical protein [Leptospiraceae bacterium]
MDINNEDFLLMATHSVFEFDGDVHRIEDVLSFIEDAGYEVQRTRSLSGGAPAHIELGYQIIGTDVTIADPVHSVYYKHIIIKVFCPHKDYHEINPKGKLFDDKTNRKIYNKLKRKFKMELLPPHVREIRAREAAKNAQ